MKKSKLNFAQKFIIVALVLIFVACGVVAYGVYDYYNPKVIDNRQNGVVYDLRYDVEENGASDVVSLFAKNFDPITPNLEQDILIYLSNPQKDVTATKDYEGYSMVKRFDNVYLTYEQIGLERDDVKGYSNREYHDYNGYYTTDYPLGLGDSYLDSCFGSLCSAGVVAGYFNATTLQPKGISSYRISFILYSAYTRRMEKYEIGNQLFEGEASVVTQLGEIEVNGIKVEVAISERTAGCKEQFEEMEENYILMMKAQVEDGVTAYEKFKQTYGRSIEEVFDQGRDGGNDILYTFVRGRFEKDGISYEIIYPLMNRWYNTESNDIGAQSTDYQKLSAVATKSMTYLVADFIK